MASAKAGPAAGAAGSSSPLLATVDVGLTVDQVLDVGAGVAAVELVLEPPRSWTYLGDLARFAEDAKWRLEVDVQGLAGGCLEPSARLKTRVRGYPQSEGGNGAVKLSVIPYTARDCERSRTTGLLTGLFVTADPLGYIDGPSMYAFALNNPANFSDPLGLEASVSMKGNFVITNPETGKSRTIRAADARKSPSSVWYALTEEAGLSEKEAEELIKKAGISLDSAKPMRFCPSGQSCMKSRGPQKSAGREVAERVASVPVCGIQAMTNSVERVIYGRGGDVPCPISGPDSEFGEDLEKGTVMLGLVPAAAGGVGLVPGIRLGPQTIVFRGDRSSRPPSKVFQEGFAPKGSNPDLFEHASTNTARSNYVATSHKIGIAEGFAGKNGYVYVIRTDRGINVVSALRGQRRVHGQAEVAIPDGVPPSEIVGAYEVRGGKIVGEMIPNPSYQP
ncbi:MAG: hypothetical protein MPN21_27130 [Thermoanaerobaculia bacterium]|nr:hypothetical protein [Thermoanaerobaculia bacterium]